jgi:glutamine amidotransferase
MKIAIIKYNAGNVQSVSFTLNRLGITPMITDDKDVISSSDKIIFPGVGEAATAMNYLKEKKLDSVIKNLRQPVLGICLGMQLMCGFSEEGNTDCLGIFDQKIKLFRALDSIDNLTVKVPKIGWNTIYNLRSALLKNIVNNSFMYFVHSYYAETGANTIASTNYILEYSSALQKNNFYAVQFHPEKSGKAGEQILKNFINL